MSRTRTMHLHLPLSEVAYQRLRAHASRAGLPATHVAREAIDHWLAEVERTALHADVADYARMTAGTDHDLDRELEVEATSHLLTSDGVEAGRR